jgi:hypothetical protein
MGMISFVVNLPSLFAGALNKVLPVGTPNQSVTGTLSSVNNAVTLATDTLGSVNFALDGSPVGASVIFESTSDGGTTWLPVTAYQSGITPAPAGSTTATAAGVYNVTTGGKQQVRVRLTAITSGSFSVTANGTASAAHVGVKNGNAADLNVTDASGASVTGRVALTVGTPGTAGRMFCAICTTAGNVSVTFSNASTGVYPLAVGINAFPWQITEVNSSGTTATATYENWL